MIINFYNNLSKKNVLNKTLSDVLLTLSFIAKKDSFNPVNPILFITTSDDVDINSMGNYCYIEETGRYYFIDNIEMTNNKIIKLELVTDFLYTFKSDILNGSGLVKSSKTANNYSSNYDVLDTIQSKTIVFPNECFDDDDTLYLTGAN